MIKREVGYSSLAKAIIFLGLLLCAGLFVKKNWEAYQSRATSMIFSTEIIERFENPTIVFCFAPALKLSVLNWYNLTEADIFISLKSNKSLTFDESWMDIYHKISFKYGIDFSFEILVDDATQAVPSNDADKDEIEDIHTFWSGLCTRLTLRGLIRYDSYNAIVLKFSETFEVRDIPEVRVYFSSLENSCKSKIILGRKYIAIPINYSRWNH